MRQMTTNELRAAQIGILNYIDALCRNNGLKYWIDYGTLLGAVRHKGYIPWDDDIDVAMFRDDYDRLVALCREVKDPRYELSCVENDATCMYPFGKMVDKDTVLYELGPDGIKTGVNVDIFVYDGVPTNRLRRRIAFEKSEFFGHLREYQLPINRGPISLRRIRIVAIKMIVSLFPSGYFNKKIVENARKYGNRTSSDVCALVDPNSRRWHASKSLFEEQTELSFEGKKYKAPKAYDEWLRIQYGDYMQLPPEEKRVRHKTEAYFKEVT